MLADPEEKQIRYDAYIASLDREEQAANALAERVDTKVASRLYAAR